MQGRLNKILNFLGSSDFPQDSYVVVGSFAILLHAYANGVRGYREVKDLDLYFFNHFDLVPGQKPYYSRFFVQGCKLVTEETSECDFVLDVLSAGFYMGDVPPRQEFSINITVGGRSFPCSSVEQIFVKKLTGTGRFRELDLYDLVFLLEHFVLDADKCQAMYATSKFNHIPVCFDGLNTENLNDQLSNFRAAIEADFSELPLDLKELSYGLLVQLLHYDAGTLLTGWSAAKIDEIRAIAAGHLPEIREALALAYLMMSCNIRGIEASEIDGVFTEILNSMPVRLESVQALSLLFMRCRFCNKLLLRGISVARVMSLLEQKDLLAGYFHLMESESSSIYAP